MITTNDISLLIVSAVRDLTRLKEVYSHIREQYPTNEIVVVYDNINELLLPTNDAHLIQVPTVERVYVSSGYNLAVQHSTKKAFVFLHDDTYTAPNFLENLIPHITETMFCNFCTVEPPVFNDPDSIQKPIRNFGLKNTPFQKEEFFAFCQQREQTLPHRTEPSPFGGFFMAGLKDTFLSVGGFDESFKPYFHEDADLMVRLHMAGFRFTLVLDSVVYHVGSLTSRHSDDSHIAHQKTFEIFLKKWKTTFEHYKTFSILNNMEYHKPKAKLVGTNCNEPITNLLNCLSSENGDVIVTVDGSTINQTDVDYLFQLPFIIKAQDNEAGLFQLGNLQIKI